MDANTANLITALNELDRQLVMVDGRMMKPSQCFRYETAPLHYMFNTNCPEELKQQVEAIFKKHMPAHNNDTASRQAAQ